MRVVSKYEVMCRSCDVKYPIGQKRCVHCGARTEPSFIEVGDSPQSFTAEVSHAEPEPESGDFRFGEGEEMIFMPAGTDSVDEEPPRGSMIRKLGGLMWLVIFVVITVIQRCFGE